MDKATEMLLQSISSKIDDVKDSHKEELHASMKAIRHYIDANGEITTIELKKINNHLDMSNGKMDTLEKETSWWRFFQRNPKATLFFTAVFILGGIVLIGADINTENISEFIKQLKFW